MPYTVHTTAIDGVLMLEPRVFGDARGFFFESFNRRDFQQATGLNVDFVQDNHSKSSQGVLRGLHYQIRHPQGKLVRVTHGVVFDVAGDMRRSSPNFGKWVGVELSAENKRQLWVPPGFAHGFLVLSEMADFCYLCSEYYHPQSEQGIAWNDPALGITWPALAENTTIQLSAKDQGNPRLAEQPLSPNL